MLNKTLKSIDENKTIEADGVESKIKYKHLRKMSLENIEYSDIIQLKD